MGFGSIASHGSRIAAIQSHWAMPSATPSYQGMIWDAQGKPIAMFQPRRLRTRNPSCVDTTARNRPI